MKRDWTLGMACVALCAALVAAGAVWVMWTADPVLTLLAGIWAAMTGLCVLAATRNLRAELANRDARLDAYDRASMRTDLDVIGGPVSPPAGTPSVLYDWSAEDLRAFEADIPGRVLGGAKLTDAQMDQARDALVRGGHIPPTPMTVAETDRLVAQLQALPGEDVTPDAVAEDGTVTFSGPGSGRRAAIWLMQPERGWHLGQPCARCDAPSTAWVSDRPDPEIRDVTFLCDEHYAETMSEEGGRE